MSTSSTYKAMVEKAPGSFSVLMIMFRGAIDGVVAQANLEDQEDDFRVALVGMLALSAAQKEPMDWSKDGINSATDSANAALERLSPPVAHLAADIAEHLSAKI